MKNNPLSQKGGVYIKYFCKKCDKFIPDNIKECPNCKTKDFGELIFYEDKQIKSAVKWLKQQFKEYYTFDEDVIKKINKAFPDLYPKK